MSDTTSERTERAYLPPHPPPANHGHTTAAWVTITLVMIAGLAVALGIAASLRWAVVAGVVVGVVGLVAGWVMKLMGYGQPRPAPRGQHEA